MNQGDRNDAVPDLRQEIGNLSDAAVETSDAKRKGPLKRPRVSSQNALDASPVPSVGAAVGDAGAYPEGVAPIVPRRIEREVVPLPSLSSLLGELEAGGDTSKASAPRSRPRAGGPPQAPESADSAGALSREISALIQPSYGETRSAGAGPDVMTTPDVRGALANLDIGASAGVRPQPVGLGARLFAPRRRKATIATLVVLTAAFFGGDWWLATRPSAVQARMLEIAAQVDAYRETNGRWPIALSQAVKLEAPLVLGDIQRWDAEQPGARVLIYGVSSDGIRYTLIARTSGGGWMLGLDNRSFQPLPK